ncbi:hypothetical protein CYMTET_32036, partial [Cymbomonas tetramitiformis]
MDDLEEVLECPERNNSTKMEILGKLEKVQVEAFPCERGVRCLNSYVYLSEYQLSWMVQTDTIANHVSGLSSLGWFKPALLQTSGDAYEEFLAMNLPSQLLMLGLLRSVYVEKAIYDMQFSSNLTECRVEGAMLPSMKKSPQLRTFDFIAVKQKMCFIDQQQARQACSSVVRSRSGVPWLYGAGGPCSQASAPLLTVPAPAAPQ